MHSNVSAIEFQRNLPVSLKNFIKTVKNYDLHGTDIIYVKIRFEINFLFFVTIPFCINLK